MFVRMEIQYFRLFHGGDMQVALGTGLWLLFAPSQLAPQYELTCPG
jgi:hypothetical protein